MRVDDMIRMAPDTDHAKERDEAMAKHREGTRMIIEAVRNCIKTSGRTISEVAQKGGFARQYLYQVLNGKTNPTLETVERIFAACDDQFSDWLQPEFGHDKELLIQFQQVLDAKGELGRAARTTLEGWLKLLHTHGAREMPLKTGRRLEPRRSNDHETSIKTGE